MATTHDIDEPLPREATILTITGPRELGFITRPLPDVGPDQALVRTCFSGVSHGTEMNVYRGYAPQWRKHYDRDTRLFRPTTEEELAHVPERGYWTAADRSWNYPLAYGYANVGRVLATGDAVDTVKPGDLVYAYQPHQTAYVAPAASLIPLPTLSTPAVGVLYSNLNTAYGGVLDADIRIDDTVVIFGQGLIGLLVAQFVRGTAARQVITVEGLPQRRAMSLSRGVDACLDPATDDVALAVRERTGGRGADVVIDASGSYAALQEAIRTAAPNTTVIALSWYGGTGGALALSDEFHHNRITIRCSQVGGIAPELSATHSLARRSAHILD
ncbi:MAG: zinc-binding alcohol dehydrogenase, partial [Thermomicrobiales bacterium]|nr:zinc-binding alcohol dehydrogenase [Thermomicrobiales bacterium]